MAREHDIIIIIGGGHNGLITAFYLAKAGLKPLVLESRELVGGCAVTEEFHPGFRCSTLAHAAGPLDSRIMREMRLEKHGLKPLASDVRLFVPSPDGRAIVLTDDVARSAASIAAFSTKDATKYGEFAGVLPRIAGVIADVLAQVPPSIDDPSSGDLLRLLKTARRVRKLGKKNMYRLLRWGPMAVADLAAEWFETELLRAAIGARGIFGTAMGPWSAGSTLVLLLRAAADPHPAGSSATFAGGMGALTQALAAAAAEAGATIRTGAAVGRIAVKDGAATGVVLRGGEEIAARAVISSADPKRTLLALVDPVHLNPDFAVKLQHYRCPGTVARVNLALDGLPRFAAATEGTAALTGRIHIGPEIDYLERAFDDSKYGRFSRQPYLEVTIPSLLDPSLVPAGKHVMSIHAQFAPFKLRGADWNAERDALADTIVNTLAAYAPELPNRILARQVITPLDLQETYGLTGGHIFHGELALDQFFTMRPLLGWARYRTPIRHLYLCGSGTHPGTGLTGLSGWNAARQIQKDLRR